MIFEYQWPVGNKFNRWEILFLRNSFGFGGKLLRLFGTFRVLKEFGIFIGCSWELKVGHIESKTANVPSRMRD